MLWSVIAVCSRINQDNSSLSELAILKTDSAMTALIRKAQDGKLPIAYSTNSSRVFAILEREDPSIETER